MAAMRLPNLAVISHWVMLGNNLCKGEASHGK